MKVPQRTNRGGPGGLRSNKGGRPKGAVGKKTRENIAKAEQGGIMPLEVMLQAMRAAHRLAEAAAKSNNLTIAQDFLQVAHDRARDAAPYLHARLKNIEHTHVPFDLSKLTDEELDQFTAIKRRLAGAAA